MKYHILWLLSLLFITACNGKDSFTISGTIDQGNGDMLYLYRMDLSGDVVLDSTQLKGKGNFRFKQAPLTEPTFLKLALSPRRFITLLGDSTEHIKVESHADRFASNYSVRNSIGSQHVQLLQKSAAQLRQHTDSLIAFYQNLPTEEQEKELERISNELRELIADYKARTGKFIMDNHLSFASYYALFLTLSDDNQILNVMDRDDQLYFATLATSLNQRYPESARVRQLYDMVLAVKQDERRAQLLEFINQSEGSGAPELSVPNLQGQEISLASLKGKVVLLSFSASWDQASVRENRALKGIYQRHQNRGFEVYQVGLERSRVLWEAYLAQEELPWINVSELTHTSSFAARTYNVQRIPANYLLDREGNIIGKDLFGSRLEEKLREVL